MPLRRIFIVIFAPILLLVISLSTVFAVDSGPLTTGTRTIDEKNGEMMQKRDELRTKAQELKQTAASQQAELRSKRLANITERLGRMIRRLGAASDRLDKIHNKLQSRINKLKDRGIDTTKMQAALDNCNAKRTAAQVAISDAKAKVNAVDTNSANVKDQIMAAEQAIKAAKRALVDFHKCVADGVRTAKVTAPAEAAESEK